MATGLLPGGGLEGAVKMRDFLRKSAQLAGARLWGRWGVLILFALLVSGVESLGAVLILLLLSLVTGTEQVGLPIAGDLDRLLPGLEQQDQLLIAAGFMAVFFLARAVLMIAQGYAEHRVANSAGAQLSSRLLAGYLAMPYEAHLRRNSAELVRNAYDTVQVFVRDVLVPSTRLISEGLIALGFLAVLFVTAPVATAAALGTLGPVILVILKIVLPRVKRLGRTSQALSRASLQTLQQCLGGIRDIKVLGRERSFSKEYAHQRAQFARAQYLRGAAQAIPRQAVETSLLLVILGFFAATVLLQGSTADTLAILGLFAYVALRLKPVLSHVLSGLNSLKFAAPAVDDLYTDFVAVQQYQDSRGAATAATPLPLQRSIRLEDVRFRYDGTTTDVLRGIDLEIHRGESIGIVGPTGGGKSTLVDLVMGLLRPTAGRVLVDGVDIADRISDWQASLGVVSQSVFLVDDTLRRNICLGLADDEIDEALVLDAVRMAQLEDFVAALPRGLDAWVGERGVRVSGGQRQRIAIARALYHQPSVLIFDEGTSALDTLTEQEIVATLQAMRGLRTVITVAHRLTTIRSCDRVLLLRQGELVDTGSYADLIDRNADFRAMAGAS